MMNIKRTFLSMLLAIGIGAQAQQKTVFVSGTSSVHPYERAQWTIEDCKAWEQKYGPTIGINCPYPPCGAMSQKEAIKKAHDLGYNSVRWWPSGGIDPYAYIDAVEQWAGWAAEYGMTVAPVFGFVYSYYGQGNPQVSLKLLESEVRTIIRHFRGDDRIIMWDIWNEPEMNDATKCPEQMDWIKQIAKWCREEGCTQAITASIVWDAGIGSCQATGGMYAVREAAEAEMDLHNFHDYTVQENHNAEVAAMVNRYKRMDNRPLVCTECMTRTNGSTYARTLTEFSKYHIHFYTWGLYTCDSNWEVKWNRSCWYAWDPMFHNALYADGEPYNDSEPAFVKNFHFAEQGEVTDPGAEYTERWSSRRSWKWMSREATKGLYCSSISEAQKAVANHASDHLYNSIAVKLGYSEYAANSTGFNNNLTSLLASADAAGMTVLPILTTSEDFSSTAASIQNYLYNVISKFYHDRRIMGWNIFRQTSEANKAAVQKNIESILRYVRYTFPNQPIFATPMLKEEVQVDTTAHDFCNLLWKLSEVVSYTEADGAKLSEKWLRDLEVAYQCPLFCPYCKTIPAAAAACHINWYAETEPNKTDVQDFSFKPINTREIEPGKRWPAWKSWMWMNRGATKGISCSSMSDALNKIAVQSGKNLYNSIRVMIDFDAYKNDSLKFYADFEDMVSKAAAEGMTVLPVLFQDKYIGRSVDIVRNYAYGLTSKYADDNRIMAWDLYYKPCANNTRYDDANKRLDVLFGGARAANPCQPLFATPSVAVRDFAADYDYIYALSHGEATAGWSNLTYGSSTIDMCYDIWCRSDVTAYPSVLKTPELGLLNYVAYCFGRPIFCAEWKPNSADGSASKPMAVFDDSHVNWYVFGTVDEKLVRNFHFTPVTTEY